MNKQPGADFQSIGEAIKDSRLAEMLERGRQRARGAGGSATNNSATSGSGTKYECELCQDHEIILQIGSSSGEWCECREWKQARRRLKASRIDDEFQRVTFNDYITEGKHPLFAKAKELSQGYVEIAIKDYHNRRRPIQERITNRYNGIGLCGEPGSGKTTLVFAIGNALLAAKIPVLYFQHREEFDRLKAYNFHGADELYERLKEFQGVLLWDDLFKTKKRDSSGHRTVADWEADASWAILNYRAQRKMPIAFSTEWSPAELINMDRSMAGRLMESCKHPTDGKQDRLVWFRLTQAERESGMDPIKTFDHRFMRLEG